MTAVRTEAVIRSDIKAARERIKDSVALLVLLRQGVDAVGMNKDFPDIAHGGAVAQALGEYEGELSWYVCLMEELREWMVAHPT